MEQSLALPRSARPIPSLDPKRIAATSIAIVVHAGLLMLLLRPAAMPERAPVVERDMVVVPTIRPVEPVPRPEPIARIAIVSPRRPDVAVPDAPPVPVDDTPAPVDVQAPALPSLPATTYDPPAAPAPSAQIVADVAPRPPYPPQALRRGIAGTVLLRIRVDARGEPVEVTVETSSGSSLLDAAAVKFVKARWHFVPATVDGQAVEAFALLPIDYALPR